ncbi:MAG TPA: PilZ domain-containing protein [Solirubrobacteraceae bacterium]|nr:PilZ domain-containing protein [Solirubrobacteraceae bacterium]
MTPAEIQDEGPKHAPMGQLYSADGTVVRVSITHREEDILLVLLDDPGSLFDQPLAGLTLESTGGRGVLRTPGTAQRVDTNLLRFFLEETADVVQRREFVRVTAAQRVVFVDLDDNVIADTVTVNLSGGGMLVRRPSSAVLEGDLFFDLYLNDTGEGGRISGTAKVIRHVGLDATAMGFADISRADRERLIHFIFDKQRVTLAVTRGDTT